MVENSNFGAPHFHINLAEEVDRVSVGANSAIAADCSQVFVVGIASSHVVMAAFNIITLNHNLKINFNCPNYNFLFFSSSLSLCLDA
jgi:hypothetical protein